MNIIKENRQKLKMSQKRCASLIGVTQQHFDRYEKGYPIPLFRMAKIAKVLKIDKTSLLPVELQPKPYQLNAELLAQIITSVDQLIKTENLSFSSENKAKLVSLLYQKFDCEQVQENMHTQIIEFANSYLQEKAS